MKIPTDFQFSQNNLQDYIECPRRFQLRHIVKLEWPAIQSEPVLEYEHHTELGSRFHQMVQQHMAGLPPRMLEGMAIDPDLNRWWTNFINYAPVDKLPLLRMAEYSLYAPFMDHRLIAKYDVIGIESGQKIVIIDWKTSTKKPPRKYLQKRIQTRLYPFLVVLAGFKLNGNRQVIPQQIEMNYWYPEMPENPEIFQYSQDIFNEDNEYFKGLVQEIYGQPEGPLLLTSNEKRCQFCNYRSLCDRDSAAGNWKNMEEEPSYGLTVPLDLDFDQIGEIFF